jgi:hypothetical protein
MLDRKTIGWTPGPLSGAFFVISGGFTISGGPDMAPGFTISGGPDMAPGLPQPADVPSADSR